MRPFRDRGRLPVPAALAALAYIPLLLSAPGRVAADTKLYLYLDPWRLLSDAVYTWDARQLGGWVPHQNVGYLWPSGPWYAFFDLISVPDWITQRLWLGTILLLAGIGTWWLARVIETPRTVAITAAFAYQLSPYVLPYISRTSALLLPWAMLPLLVGLTVRMCRRFRWWQAVAFAAAIATAGGLNATALLVVLPAPALWAIVEFMEQRHNRRAVIRTVAVQSVVTIGASAWWMAGLSTQARYGASVLSYSETLPSTSATSSSTEVLRGLGYWLFYDRPPGAPLTTASTPYQTNLVVIAAGVTLVITGLVGLALAVHHRRALSAMLLAGVVLAVGAHPFADPTPLWSPFADRPTGTISLALRSSSRAVPLVSLALAIGLGWTVHRLQSAVRTRRPGRFTTLLVPAFTAVVLLANLPALVGGRLIDPNVSRPGRIPTAWIEAADFLDNRYDEGMRGAVLIVPGIESQAFRWGYTVDPILPGLTRKPIVTRDWLPLGSAPLMDLVYALDDSLQSGTARAESIAPVARLLGADTVMVVNSYQYERFGTVRPERAATVINASTPGLTPLVEFGAPSENRAPVDRETHRGELDDLPFRELPEIQLYAVESPFVSGTTSHPVVISGDGSSLVDMAATGLLDQPGVRLMSASFTGGDLAGAVADAAEVIVTDGNRIRAHHWRSSQEVWGATEPLTGVLDAEDVFDSRLPVFPLTEADPSTRSYIAPAPVTATATAYGALLTYRPEYRPLNAVDGDPDTAWLVGWGVDPVGQTLTVTSESTIGSLDLTPVGTGGQRITAVDVSVDGGDWYRTATGSGPVELTPPGLDIRIRIAGVGTTGADNADPDVTAVGFAEVLPAAAAVPEVVQVPVDATSVVPAGTPVSFVFTRLRADDYDVGRSDPETAIRRSFDVPHTDSFVVSGTVDPTTLTNGMDGCSSGLLSIDGTAISVIVDGDGRLSTCSGDPVEMVAGTHLVTTADSSERGTPVIDQLVLRSRTTPRFESESQTSGIDGDRTGRAMVLPACDSTVCWAQTTEGWNAGWRARLGSQALSDPVAGASGRNTWRVDNSPGSTLTATWTPQVHMWWGLSITGLTFVILLALAVRDDRRRRPQPALEALQSLGHVPTTRRPEFRTRLVVGLATLGLTTMVVGPVWGAAGLLIVVATPTRVVVRTGLVISALAMLFVIAQQVRTGADAGFGWPSVFARAHRPALFGVTLFVVGIWAGERERAPDSQ